jgi:hypothetical protein
VTPCSIAIGYNLAASLFKVEEEILVSYLKSQKELHNFPI